MAHFAAFTLTQKTPRERASQVSHVVNNAMAIKAAGVWYVQSTMSVTFGASTG